MRYAENPFRLAHYQFQVVMKPSPHDTSSRCTGSLEAMGIDLSKHDVRRRGRLESPTLSVGAG
jgi:glycyl-tRNA synthetase alpha chain